MGDRIRPMKTKSGRTLTEAELQRLAENAERGLDLSPWKPRRGRPRLDPAATEHAPRVAARVSASVYSRARWRAAQEGRTISEVVRHFLEGYAADADRVEAPAPDVAPTARRS